MQKYTIYMILTIGIIKFIALSRDILVANYFGINQIVDIYFYALIIPIFLFNTISASFNYFFIPSYLTMKGNYGAQKAGNYVLILFFYAALALIILAFLCGWIIPTAMLHWNQKILYEPRYIELFFILSKWTAIFFLFYTLSSLFSTLLQAEHNYIESLYPQILIFACSLITLIFGHQNFGIVSAVMGSCLGAFLCMLYQISLCCGKGLIGKVNQVFNTNIRIIFPHLDQLSNTLIASIPPSFVVIVDQQIASHLGIGQLSSLNYGILIADGFAGILSLGLGTAIFSHFSIWGNEKQFDRIAQASQRAILAITFLLLPFCAFLSFFAHPIITVALERGAVHRGDTLTASKILTIYAFTIYFTCFNVIGLRIISAIRKSQYFLISAIINLGCKVLFNILFVNMFGLIGIPIATLITYLITCCVTYYFVRREGIIILNTDFIYKIAKCVILFFFIVFVLFISWRISLQWDDIFRLLFGITILLLLLGTMFRLNQRFQLVKY